MFPEILINICWLWCEKWLPHRQKLYTIGISTICWAIWKTRNNICFQGKNVTSPITIICYACSLISYWAGLFEDLDKEELSVGAETMLKIALQLVGKAKSPQDQDVLKEKDEDAEDN